MQVVHRLNEIDFVWDSTKAALNFQKHGVAFEEACEIFFDPFVRYTHSEAVGREERETSVGMTSSWKVVLVVYTLREDSVRLISARPATGPERRAYENEPTP